MDVQRIERAYKFAQVNAPLSTSQLEKILRRSYTTEFFSDREYNEVMRIEALMLGDMNGVRQYAAGRNCVMLRH